MSVASAVADEGPFSSTQASLRQLDLALEAGSQKVDLGATNPEAANALPKHGLDRDEAEEVLTSVFGSQIEGDAAALGSLDVQKYLSNYAAVVKPEESPLLEPGTEGGGPLALVESTLPLRTEDVAGNTAAVSLQLEQDGDVLQPANPLTEVEIPEELGNGVRLSEAGVSIELAGAPTDRTPSRIEGTTAFYPNVATDTDLSVLPTATGVETLTQLRTPAAPNQQEFELAIPNGAVLSDTDEGGAKVTSEGETLVSVAPPVAIDATGAEVPSSLEVKESSLVVSVDPTGSTTYPVLVDPTYDYYQWNAESAPAHQAWEAFNTTTNNTWQLWMSSPWGGLYGPTVITGYPGEVTTGTQANWSYHVPRWSEELSKGREPTSYIQAVTVYGLELWMQGQPGQRRDSPYMLIGIWDPSKWQWSAVGYRNGIEGGLQGWTGYFYAQNEQHEVDTHARWFQVGFASSENGANDNRWLTDQGVMVELNDTDFPLFERNGAPTGWVNTSSIGNPITFEVSDPGLGVFDAFVGEPTTNGQLTTVTTHYNDCTGGAVHPCPRTWSSGSGPSLRYEPSIMPTGEDWVQMWATDPVGHNSAWRSGAYKPNEVKLKVDHVAPKLSVGGSITEQKSVGTTSQTYNLKYAATDGTDVPSTAGAALGSLGTEAGKFNGPGGIVTDHNGHVWVVDRKNNRVEEFDEAGQFIRQFGSAGSGNGQFHEPYGITVTSEGNVWVTDEGNHRVQEFSPTGTYIQQFGTSTTGNPTGTQFNQVAGIAAAPGGMLWVSDYAGRRIAEFRENPGGAERFVRNVSGAELGAPNGMAVDAQGNLWATDEGCNCILSFSPSGQYLTRIGGTGTGPGQLELPTNVAVSPTGNFLVSDTLNNRIEQFKPNGEFVRQFASNGTGSGNLSFPEGVALLNNNMLWIGDNLNNRVARWSNAEYDPQSGAAGVQVKVDGTVQKTETPGCATRDCKIENEWLLEATKFSDGSHTVEVTATDGVGLTSTPVKIPIVLNPDRTAPTVSLTGSMTEQASLGTTRPRYVLKMAASDPALAGGTSSGVASTRIRVDGKTVDSTSPGCTSGGCSLSREWTLNSSAYSAGPHTIEATATDVVGLATTKTLTINVARDTSPPQITANAALYTAPEGWVEQQAYPYTASASDPNGYGATSLVLKIDGAVVKEASASCTEGACQLPITGSIDMSAYRGGAHAAELIATDGAGNKTTRPWTINVDPEGHVSAEEAEDTLEAVEETSSVNPIGPAEEQEGYDGTAPGLGLVEEGGTFVASGTPVPTEISSEGGAIGLELPNAGTFAGTCGDETEEEAVEPCITTAEREQLALREELGESAGLETVQVTPLDREGSPDPTLVAGEVLLTPNAEPQVDESARPLAGGAMAFEAIRAASAPEDYSWRVQLEPGQELRQISDQEVAAYWEGEHLALDFVAEPASDAIGTAVPSSLKVTGKEVITLTIHHRSPSPAGGSFVYPVVAGTGWLGGFQTYMVEMPPPEEASGESGEEESTSVEATEHDVHVSVASFSAPTTIRPYSLVTRQEPEIARAFNFHECRFMPVDSTPSDPGGHPTTPLPPRAREELGKRCHGERDMAPIANLRLAWGIAMVGQYRFRNHEDAWLEKAPLCKPPWGPEGLAVVHCDGPVDLKAPKVSIWEQVRFPPGHFEAGLYTNVAVCGQLEGVLPDRYVKQETGRTVLEETQHWAFDWLEHQDETCPWGHLRFH